jgi:hypothetical protein
VSSQASFRLTALSLDRDHSSEPICYVAIRQTNAARQIICLIQLTCQTQVMDQIGASFAVKYLSSA